LPEVSFVLTKQNKTTPPKTNKKNNKKNKTKTKTNTGKSTGVLIIKGSSL